MSILEVCVAWEKAFSFRNFSLCFSQIWALLCIFTEIHSFGIENFLLELKSGTDTYVSGDIFAEGGWSLFFVKSNNSHCMPNRLHTYVEFILFWKQIATGTVNLDKNFDKIFQYLWSKTWTQGHYSWLNQQK